MIVLEADEATFKKCHKYTNANGRFEFRELSDGRWIIHEDILNSPDFTELIPDLCKLQKINFNENDF